MGRAAAFLALLSLAHAGTVIDQIAVVVAKHPIKTSDIDRDLRVTQFLNGQAPDFGLAQKRMSAQRLIDQELIRQDLAQRGNTTPLPDNAKAVLERLVQDRFHGSDSELAAELRRRGLTRTEVLDELQWQLVVLRFIDQRFRPAVIVSDADIRDDYQQHPGKGTLEEQTPAIRTRLEGDRINSNFEAWLDQARKSAAIDYKMGDYKEEDLK